MQSRVAILSQPAFSSFYKVENAVWLYTDETSYVNRGFAGRSLEVKWLPMLPISSDSRAFSAILRVNGITRYIAKTIVTILIQLLTKHITLFNMYQISCFHNENDLTKLIRLVSGRNTIFMYKLPSKLPYLLTSKMAEFLLLTWLRTNYFLRHTQNLNTQLASVIEKGS